MRHSQKSLHSKTSSSYLRVRRQTQQTSPQYPQTQQNSPQYPNTPYTNPNEPYPLQTYPNNPVDQTLLLAERVLNPVPYSPYPGTYVQPVVVANPYVVPAVPIRGKRSPQEVFLTSTEISLPPEVAAEISERLRELLLALISAQDGLVSNSTEISEKDAEVIESVTNPPRKRRDTQSDSQPEPQSPLVQMFSIIRERVNNGPFHTLARGYQNMMSNTTSATGNSSTSSPPVPSR